MGVHAQMYLIIDESRYIFLSLLRALLIFILYVCIHLIAINLICPTSLPNSEALPPSPSKGGTNVFNDLRQKRFRIRDFKHNLHLNFITSIILVLPKISNKVLNLQNKIERQPSIIVKLCQGQALMKL